MSLHKKISFVKSAWRLLGYLMLLHSVESGVAVLLISELIGILEEFGEK